MNDLTLTRPGEENTCSAGLGRLATCREGWEFLQQKGWGDGGMEKVEKEEEVPMCLWPPDMKLDRMDALFSLCQICLVSCKNGRICWKINYREWDTTCRMDEGLVHNIIC